MTKLAGDLEFGFVIDLFEDNSVDMLSSSLCDDDNDDNDDDNDKREMTY